MRASWTLTSGPPGAARLEVTGDLDLSAEAAFSAAVEHAIVEHELERLVIVLFGVEFLDSSGLRALLRVTTNNPGVVWIDAPSPAARRLLDITGTWAAFRFVDPAEEARR